MYTYLQYSTIRRLDFTVQNLSKQYVGKDFGSEQNGATDKLQPEQVCDERAS